MIAQILKVSADRQTKRHLHIMTISKSGLTMVLAASGIPPVSH